MKKLGNLFLSFLLLLGAVPSFWMQAIAQGLPQGFAQNNLSSVLTGGGQPAGTPTLAAGSLSSPAGSIATPAGLGSSLDLKPSPVIRNPVHRSENQEPRVKPAPRRELPDIQTTEFQKFVQSSSGKALPLFGYDFFKSDIASSLQDVPVPTDYVLGPGDEVVIRIWGSVDADIRATIDRNGQISIPRVGVLNLSGVKSTQLEAAVRNSVSRVYNGFQVHASLGQLRSMQIYVVGQARTPGVFQVSSLSSLLGAIFETGGPSAMGSMRNIQLRRDGRTVATIDLYKFITEGDKSGDMKLLPGDVIVIPSAGSRVAILGALDRPAIYELAIRQESLSRLLAYSGTAAALTSVHQVLVERIDTTQTNAPRQVEEISLNNSGLNSVVRDGDMVTLFPIKPAFANDVTLRGNVALPLRHAYRSGMRVSDLIPDREALITADYYTKKNQLIQAATPNSNTTKQTDVQVLGNVKNIFDEIHWDYAVIERLSKTDLRMQLIPFNLGKAIVNKDPTENLLLQPGDVLTVFGVKEVPIPIDKRSRFVRVAGEVNVPGVYQVQPGETLSNIVRRAGGITSNAYVYGSQFTRESVRVQQQANLERAVRVLEAESSANTQMMIQNAVHSGAGGQKLDNSQALTMLAKEQVERLKKLQPSGRIALDLEPMGLAFPSIGLEDGDTLTVPARPDFVGIYGAVLSEATLLHKAGATVNEYLKKSGLTRFSDTEGIVIARADGSLESANGQGSWFSSNTILYKTLYPGDSVFVPEIVDKRTGYTKFIDGMKDWTSIVYQLGLGVAAWKVLKN